MLQITQILNGLHQHLTVQHNLVFKVNRVIQGEPRHVRARLQRVWTSPCTHREVRPESELFFKEKLGSLSGEEAGGKSKEAAMGSRWEWGPEPRQAKDGVGRARLGGFRQWTPGTVSTPGWVGRMRELPRPQGWGSSSDKRSAKGTSLVI